MNENYKVVPPGGITWYSLLYQEMEKLGTKVTVVDPKSEWPIGKLGQGKKMKPKATR